ncbi:hypothetical protein E4T43_03964 [Aureobasidium subglaciale]|nr:hypothetical protein E4T43_03964 [Aureobasidium subglaciale]
MIGIALVGEIGGFVGGSRILVDIIVSRAYLRYQIVEIRIIVPLFSLNCDTGLKMVLALTLLSRVLIAVMVFITASRQLLHLSQVYQ